LSWRVGGRGALPTWPWIDVNAGVPGSLPLAGTAAFSVMSNAPMVAAGSTAAASAWGLLVAAASAPAAPFSFDEEQPDSISRIARPARIEGGLTA
jgi:hypothetical protein